MRSVVELQDEMAGSSQPWTTTEIGDEVIRRL
jgi:hypothetical protein